MLGSTQRSGRVGRRESKKQSNRNESIHMKQLFAILTTVLVAGFAYADDFPDITINDLKSAIEAKKVVVIDVNGTESWQKGHIPGAIDFATDKAKLAEVLPKEKDTLVVAYCGGPKCKAYKKAAKAVKELGFTNVKHLSQGISGWTQAGERIEQGS